MNHEELKVLIENDPANERFPEYADFLRKNSEYKEALYILIKGLNGNPNNYRGRLILARVYYELDCWYFAVRELEVLYFELPNTRSSIRETIKKLIAKLNPEKERELENRLNNHSVYYNQEPGHIDDKYGQSATLKKLNSEEQENILAEGEFDIADIELIDKEL
jgi:lipopolysaccharide biosynthesis regulator YciM